MTTNNNIMYIGIVFAMRIVGSFASTHASYMFMVLGLNISHSISATLFKKALNVSFLSNKEHKSGEMVNLL